MNKQTKELYDALSQNGVGVGTEQDFEIALNSDEGVNEILGVSKEKGFIPQDWGADIFKQTFSTATEEPQKSSLRNEAYSTLSDDDLHGKYNEMLIKAEQRKKEAIDKAKAEQDKFTKEHPFLYAASQVGGAPMNINQPSINPIEALEKNEVSFYLDENDKNEFNSLRKEIGVRNYESGFETIKKSTEDEENRVKNIRANAEANGVRLSARDRSMLRKAEEINRDARELVEAGSKYGNEKGIENWADGLSNTLLDRDMIAGVGLIRDMKVDNLVEKLNNDEKLSESENALLLAAYNFEEVAKARSFDLSAGYKIGQGTAESIPFVVDMLITRGMTNVGKAALLKLLASKGKDVAKLARIMDVSLDGSKVVRATTGEKLLHSAYELGETALQTTMMPSSQRQMMQEKTAIRKETGNNDIAFRDRARIFGNAYVQTFTERAGGKAIDWALGKMIPSGNLLARFGYKEGVLKSLNDIIQSPLSEVGEEYLGSAINLLRSIDLFNIYSQESNEDMRNEAMSLFSAEGFREVVGTTLPMSLFGGAANGIAIATKTNQFNKAHLAFGKMLEEAGATNAQAENILAQIERASSQEEFNERLSAAKGFLKKHIQETETDLGIANTKMQNVEKIIDNYNNSATTFNNAIKDLRKLYAEMPQEKKDAMKADFENMRRKLNESITMTQQPEGPVVTHKEPESGWQKRTMSVEIDGKNTKVTFSGNVVFNEDGSINTSLSNMDNFRLQNDKGQNVRTTVKGEEAKQKKFDTYLDAVNNALRKEKTEKDKKIAEQKAAEEAIKAERKRLQEEEKRKMEEENARIEAQKQAIAQQEADRQSIIASFPKDKNGEVDIDKMSPEQFFVYESDTDTPEAAMNTVGDVLNDLYQQLEDNANETNKEKRARNAAKIKNRIRQYEAVVVKYAGQETLDTINAARAEALQNTPPVQEGAPVVAEQGETPAPAEPTVAPKEDTPQDDEPAEPDTTPLPPAEPETKGATIEPIDLGGDDIVFVSNSSNVTRVAQRKEDGNLYFVDNGKPVSNAWKETASKVKVYYNGRPYYLLSKTARIGKNGSVVGLNITVHLAPEMYTGKDSELNEIPRDKISLDEQGNQTATGNKLAERVANYKSLSDFFNKVIYNAGGVKLTLGELLEIPVVNANKGKGAPSWQFQVKRFIEQQEGKRNQTDVRADIEAGLKELIADWNAYVKANGLTDVVTEDNATDYYSRLKELGGYTSNGLLVQSTDFNGGKLNSADATKNPILQLLVMLDQASELTSEKGPSLKALEVSNIRGYVQKKPSSMTTEEIEAEMFLTNNQGERVKNDGISTQRYNALNAELERRQAPEREAQGQLEKELDEKERNQEEQLIDSYANEIVNLLAASSNGNAIQKAAARGRVIDMLKGNSTLRKGVYDKLASMQNEDSAEVIESAMNLIAKHYPEAAKTSTKKAEQEKPKPATSTPSLKELNDEYNDIKSKLDEYYYETEEEIDAANKRLAELRALLENTAFMVGDVAESSASQEAKELALAAEIQVLADSEEIDVLNVTQEQAEEARRTGKGEMQVSNETQRIFVSNAERAVESIKQEKATPQQWKAMIEKQGGLKAGEDKWLGLSEWLDNQEKKTLTRQEILDFISENQILIVELDYADASSLSEDAILNSEYFSMLVDELLDWSGDEPVIDMDKYHKYQEDPDFVDGFGTDYWNETLIVRDPAKAAKYLGMANPIHSIRLRYTTEELDKKKEIAIVVPTIDSYNETDNIHFGDAGNGRAVAWIRFGETTDESGNRVLVIDEIQSKRHQDGRDKGYSNTIELRKKIEEAKQKIADINAKSTNNVQRIDELISEIKELRKDNEEKEDAERYELARLREEQDNVRNNRDYDRLQAEIDEISETQLKRLNHISKLNTELRLLQDRALDSASSDEVFDLRMEIQNYELELLDKVPDAPFDKNWHELAFKRMLRYAAENGFDYVAWTTGAQQAERYDIGEVINKIITTSHTFRGNPRKSVRMLMTNGNRVSMSIDNTGIVTSSDGGIYNGKNLSEIVGKELADRIINNEGKDATLYSDYTNEEIPAKELSGDNLRIGGEGMKGFYDKMLPSFVSKYTKKWGAKVQDINLPELEESAQTMHAVNVTPEMKESVMQGQPMFSIESTPLMTSKGVIYGYALGNKIYLTPDGMNTNTPVHEYTHIWAKAMQKHNPKAWKSIIEQLKKAEALWNEVVNDPNYENIKNDEGAIASEVLSRYSGKNGAAKLEAEAERVASEYKGMEKGLKVKALISRVKKALEKFWSWVGKDLFKIESFESVESIADRVLYDMLNNTQLNLDNSKKSSTFVPTNKVPQREKAVAYSALFAKTKGEYTKGIDFASSSNYMHYFRNGEHIGAIEINGNEDLIKLINKEVYGINESTERFAEIAKTIGDEYRSNYRNHDRIERLGEQNDRDDTVRSGQSSERGANQREVFADNAEREQIIAEAKANGTYMMHNGQPTNLTEDQWVTVRTQAFKDYFGDWINDKDNASVVLDENGEPLVVYHGSRMAGFDQFGRGEARDSQGIYTTPNRRAAESYATSIEEWKSGQTMPEAELGVPDHHGVYSLFVNMRNPKVIDFGGKRFDEYGEPKYEVATNEALDNGERGILFDTLEEAEAYIAEHPEEDLDYVEKRTTSDDMLVQAKEEGYDGVIFTNIIDSRYPDPITNYVPFESNQVKSATQNIGTFNPEDNRIEFMIGPAIDAKQKEGIEKASNKLVKGIAANVPLPERMNELGKIWTEVSDGGEVFRQLLKALREFNAKHGLGRKLPEGSDVRQVYTNSRSVLANKLTELANMYEKPLRNNLEELIEVVKVSSMYDKYKKEMRTVEEEVIQDGKAVSVLKQIEHELTPREFIERYLIACDNIERYQNGIPTRGLAMFKQWMGVDVIEFQAEFEAAFGASKEGKALLKNLWKSINDYTNYTLEDSFACEMIKPEEYYRRKGRKFYIPERDFAIDKDLEQPEVAPKKRYKSNKLSSSIKAKGGESLAANIIENIFYIGNTDLQKNNKNRVKLAMWNLLQANPEFRASIGLPRPEEVWYDRDGKRVTNAPTREERKHMRLLQDEIFRLEYLLDEELSKEEALQDKEEIDSLNEELKKAYKEREDIPYMLEYEARHRFQSEGDPNLVGVYVNGTMCSMSFPNMSLAAIALNDAWDKSPNIWNPIRWIKGHISSVITAIEPAFFLKNVPTDGMSIILKGAVQYGWEFSLRYIATAKDILKHGKLVGTYVSGGDYRSLENGELFRDFLMNGGNTGYSSARSMDKILKELESLDRGHSSIKEAMEQSKKSLTFMNECTELLLRFAAYKTAIDMGKGVEEATNAANNLSANFNRRGERVPLSENVALHTKAIYGFIRMFKELSMFYNPAMQGAMQFFRMFGESGALDTKEKVERWASIVVNAMFIPALAGFLNAMMFRDDEEEEWSVTEYDRANYLVIGKNGRFAMGHMTRPFYNIGVNIALHMQGRRDGGKIADSILTSFLTHLTPCAPSLSNIGVKTVHSLFGGQELNLWDYLQSFTTPEALAVFNEAADGVNFMGQQIKYDDEKIAMHTKNPNAGVIEKVLAKMWFCVGGGEWDGVTTLKRNGEGDVHDMFNVTPNEVRTFLSLLMPKTFIDTGNVIAGAVQNVVDKERGEYIGNNIKLKNIPFFNTFISERTPEAYRNGIYSEANKIARANKLVMDKAYKEMVRISVKMNNELSDEEYRDLEKRYERFEAIYNQAAGDVIAGTLREILPAYKEVRFSNIQKKFSMNEKELRKYLSDLDYDSLEESERELIFNMSQLVQMKKGCGPINSKIPQWMKGVFGIEPTSAEVKELWDTYEEYIEK